MCEKAGLTQKVKLDDEFFAVLFLVEGDVLHPEGAAADCVGLVFVFLVASPQGQFVDEVEGHGTLSQTHFGRLQKEKFRMMLKNIIQQPHICRRNC